MMRWVLGLVILAGLSACASSRDLNEAPVPLGDFRLEHNIVIANNAQRGPLSRPATEEQLTAAVKGAVAERFGRYNGASRYHFGISVEGYVLAQPGIPLVLAPKSALILNVTVWDDAAGGKLNDEPEQITVLETFGTAPIIGTGYTMTAEEQLKELSQNAAKAVERFLVKQRNEQGWFSPEETSANGPETQQSATEVEAPAAG
ncbi:hypothetical protein GCM10007385_11270 [Tateyamaria omphalii]|uniref:hypothetical protein n=1 Tax=Tateyamaria omphalii TaxID=299262 RepID=UPI00167ABC98|nr:hypothetical protein [Tateyamaria omphalii]GGX45047.1 hypothetical protein GCM10007385_11270 [Tateyamaria omphalii]